VIDSRAEKRPIFRRSPLSHAVLTLFAFVITRGACGLELIILHTSDLHGHVHPRDELADKDFGEGLARVASAVRSARAEGHATLLLDSGDTIQGTPLQAQVFSGAVGDGTDPTIRAMNLIGYDAMTVGNHEFDFGPARLERSRGQAKFPWLSANIVREKGEPAFAPYAIRVIGGVRVGILGLTTKTVASWESPDHVAGLRFLDSVDAARRFVSLLRGKEHCDVVVVLTHQGFERDPATGEDRGSSEENQAYALATQVPGVDLLLTGHTHTAIAPVKIGGVWASQPGRFGNTLTRFDLELEKEKGRWVIRKIAGRNLPMKEVAPDPEIVASVEGEFRASMARLSEIIATLQVPVRSSQARTADTGLLDWLHTIQEREGKADLSFASLLPGALPEWPSGGLTVRQVWSFYPYENTLVTVRATGRQVREALEIAGRCVSGIAIQEGHPVWKRNASVWGYNCDTLDGADYALDPMRPEGARVLFLKRGGKPVEDDDVFSVAINSYRASGGGGYGVWKSCPRLSTSRESLRDLLMEDARKRKVLRLEANENWFLAPALPEGKLSN
jgi:2',3'-cyclic-nucleotide 2'-phosphodiesterase/3'-nucleotidase